MKTSRSMAAVMALIGLMTRETHGLSCKVGGVLAKESAGGQTETFEVFPPTASSPQVVECGSTDDISNQLWKQMSEAMLLQVWEEPFSCTTDDDCLCAFVSSKNATVTNHLGDTYRIGGDGSLFVCLGGNGVVSRLTEPVTEPMFQQLLIVLHY